MRVRLAAFLACLCAFAGLGVVLPAQRASARTVWPHVVVGGFSTPTGDGGWVVYADGAVSAFGDGRRFGDASAIALNAPIVGGAGTPDGGGYWLVAADGGIFSYGNARFFGSMGAKKLNQPVFSMAATSTGRGYWLVAYDGGIFTFGDARFYGSLGAKKLNQPINGIITSPGGKGYRMVARDGGIFSFGDAPFYGSAADTRASDIVGMAPTPSNKGYWIARRNGSVLAYGDAPRYRDVVAGPFDPVAAIFSSPTRPGFSLVLARGTRLSFGPAPGTVNKGLVTVPAATPYDVIPTATTKSAAALGKIATHYGSRIDQRVDLYLPDARFTGPRPVIVWLHSGGWVGGDRTSIPAMILRQVLRGFVLASVDYGLAPQYQFPSPLRDVKRAIRWLKVNAKTYRIDTKSVIVAGGSAGGHLAALAGVTPGLMEPTGLTGAMTTVDSKVLGVLDFVGPTNMTTFATVDHPWAQNLIAALLDCTAHYPKPIECPPNALHDASMTSYLDASDPPIYMGYGLYDTLVRPPSQGAPSARAYANALGASGARVWYEVANTDHNLEQDNVNMRYLELFIDTLVARTLK
jgi:acetyl esterase/lipase